MMEKRLFIALDIAHSDKVKINQWRNSHLRLPFKPICPSNFHITLAFLGMVNPQQQNLLISLVNQHLQTVQQLMKPLMQLSQTLPITLSEVGYFKKAQVLHIFPRHSPTQLNTLNKWLVELCLRCNIIIEHNVYKPHVSLYRKVKFDKPVELTKLLHTKLELPLTIVNFSLYHSQSTKSGVQYQPIYTWQLRG